MGNDLDFRRTERDVAIDDVRGADASDRLRARSQVVIPAEDNDGDLAVGANQPGRAQPQVGRPDDLDAGVSRLGVEQRDLDREVSDVDLSSNSILRGAADDRVNESVMDDVNGLTDSRADDLLDRSTQFRQFDDVNNLDGRASHGRADYYGDDEPHADDGYDSCAYGQCSRKV